MASEGLIARRPAKDSQFAGIRAGDKDCLSVSVTFGWPNEKVYAMFHPEFIGENGRLTKTGKTQCAQFFAYAKHREYMDAYRETLAKSGGGRSDSGEELAIDDGRKDKALQSYFNNILKLLNKDEELDPDTLKVVTEILKKIGWLKEDGERIVAPVRILPALCKKECRYRKFVETAKMEGDLIDDCDYCKARGFAEEHGFVYDPCTVLDLPEEVIKEIDSHNDIKLLDILDGRVNN
ncbi:MAG: hypothetical protein K2H46_07335 [Muribaculaceae bacterium]|nr:hypothetical protein [Muribaculaceae bacterium]